MTGKINEINDDALLLAASEGDVRAFEELFTRHYPRVFGVLMRVVGNEQDAEELAVDVFMRLYEGRLDPSRGTNVGGWLYRTATNAGFNSVRSRRRRGSWLRKLFDMSLGEQRVAEDPARVVERRDQGAEVRDALLQLPERQRDALALRASGLSYAEVAEVIGVSPSSVGTLVARGERKLRTLLSQEARES